MGFSRQEYWSGLPFLLQGIFPPQSSDPCLLFLLHWQAGSFTTGITWEALWTLAAAAKLLQSCPTLCDPMDCSLSRRVRRSVCGFSKNNFCSCHPFPHSGYREVRVWGGRRWGVRWAEDRLWKHKAENVVDTSQPTWFLGVLGWLSGPHLMWFVKRSHPAWFPCLSKCNKLPSPELAGLVAPSEVNSVPHTGSLKLLGLKLPFLFFLSLFF